MIRLAALGLFHEANTFSPILADRELYNGGTRFGDDIIEQHADADTIMGGFLAASQLPGIQVVPLILAHVNAVGPLTQDAFENLVTRMLHAIREEGPWDGVLLALHGAAVAEHIGDADGEIAGRVRHLVGANVPIGITLDMHANLSQRIVDAATVATVYQTNPHIDAREQASKCANLIVRTIRSEIVPKQSLVMLPLVVNIARQDTSEQPMSDLVREAAAISEGPGMLSASVVEGFPYADVPEMGMSCLAIHNGDLSAASAAAQALARAVWRRRTEMQATGLSVHEALERPKRASRRPVVLLDVGDNIGGGAPGDSTEILEAAVRGGVRSFMQTLWDPESVRKCVVAGIGANVELTVGARHPHSAGAPVPVTGRVRHLSDGRYEDRTPTHGGFRFFDMGTSAVIDTADGHTLVLTSRQLGNTSLQQLRSVGVEPTHYRIIVAKGVNAPRAAYRSIASELVLVDTNGITGMDLRKFTYRCRRRPLYPFEAVTLP